MTASLDARLEKHEATVRAMLRYPHLTLREAYLFSRQLDDIAPSLARAIRACTTVDEFRSLSLLKSIQRMRRPSQRHVPREDRDLETIGHVCGEVREADLHELSWRKHTARKTSSGPPA